MSKFTIDLAGVSINYSFQFEKTKDYFGNWLKKISSDQKALKISEQFWYQWNRQIGNINPRSEYTAFAIKSSDILLNYDRCIFHAAAVSYHGKAWLITAPSGVGKTTQVRTLQELYPNEFTVISGDKPVLEYKHNGSFTVHPSPWNGKEGWNGSSKATLEGIIILQRGNENTIEILPSYRSAARIYSSILQTAEDEKVIKKAAKFATTLIDHTPIWLLTNQDIPDSTKLLYENVIKGDS